MLPSPVRGLREHWVLDPSIIFLNHGSFGACPSSVLEHQAELRHRMEREPVDFFLRRLPVLVDEARSAVAEFLGARPENLVFVRNATEGVNSVLSSLSLAPGDELLLTDHGYNACWNAARHLAGRCGAEVRMARVPFPPDGPEHVVEAVFEAFTPRTRLLLIDHVTSPTGLVFPIERLACEAASRGLEVLVDGAHGPGMLALELERLGELGVTYYTGNFHKWCCAPKGAAMLWVTPARQASIHPAVISHGYNSRRPRARFLEEFDWLGTDDPTPWLAVPTAVRFLEGLVEGGWPQIRRSCRELALYGRGEVASALGVTRTAPEEMIGNLAALPLPDAQGPPPQSPLDSDPLQQQLFEEYRIEVPIVPWSRRLVRISAFLYNTPEDYAALAAALKDLF